MSVYVFDSESASLSRYASPADALNGRAPDFLRAQRWLFFRANGEPLRVDVLADGSMQLRPWASCSSCTLAQVLPFVMHFDVADEELADLNARLAG